MQNFRVEPEPGFHPSLGRDSDCGSGQIPAQHTPVGAPRKEGCPAGLLLPTDSDMGYRYEYSQL